MQAIVALDAGTGGGKCSVFDVQGRRLGQHAEQWTYAVSANRDVPMVKEYSFDPEAFWACLARCTRIALEQSGVSPGDVIGVATTSQREGCVFLDADGAEIYAGPNLDSRGFLEGLEVMGSLGLERLYQITGHSAPFIFPLARYLWFRKHRDVPVARILMINDWMAYRLSGVAGSEPSNATESMLFDFRQRAWSTEILDRYDIPATALPALYRSGEQLGVVTSAAAAATGLREGTPVFTGGADTQCALLGAGACEAGDVGLILGTTTPVQAVVEAPMLDPAANLWAGCHVLADRWVIESNAGSTGDAYLWLLDLLVPGGEERYARAEALARAERDSGAFTFIGPRVFDLTKLRPDMPGGVFFRFPTLQLRPTAGALLRAFLESIAYAARANLAQIAAVTGAEAARLVVGGGMSRNDLLIELVADITGLSVHRAAEPESTGLGCAILVAHGAGLYPTLGDATRVMSHHRIVEAESGRHGTGEYGFSKWRELYESLEGMSL